MIIIVGLPSQKVTEVSSTQFLFLRDRILFEYRKVTLSGQKESPEWSYVDSDTPKVERMLAKIK